MFRSVLCFCAPSFSPLFLAFYRRAVPCRLEAVGFLHRVCRRRHLPSTAVGRNIFQAMVNYVLYLSVLIGIACSKEVIWCLASKEIPFFSKPISFLWFLFILLFLLLPYLVRLLEDDMLWRCRSLICIRRGRQIFQLIPFKLVHCNSYPMVNCDNRQAIFQTRRKKINLTHDIVYDTLLNCPSDTIVLGFFIWCARQPEYFHNAQSFDHMISVVTRLTKRYTTVRGIVDELESVGSVTKAQTFLLLIRIYWRGRMYHMVLEAFEQMSSSGFTPNTFAHNVIMDVLFKIGHVDTAINVLKEMHLPNFLTFNIALCNICTLNDMVRVRDIIKSMLSKGFYPDAKTFEMMLTCFCKKGNLAEGYQVLGLMIALGNSLTVNAWTILIDGFCRLRRLDMACHFLKKMVDSGCSPNVVTYTSLIKGFMNSERFNSACSMISAMESKGLARDLIFYNVYIDCLRKLRRYDDALDVFVSLMKQKLVPDSYTFCSLVSVVCFSRRFYLLPKLVSGLAVEADLVVCNSLLSYFCKAGFPNVAVEFYNEMLEMGFVPDQYSFVGLLSGLCGSRKIDEAVKVYQRIVMDKSSVLDAHAHTVIIDSLIRVGQCHRAIRLFKKAIVEKYPLDVVSYTVAILGLVKGGRMGEVSVLYYQMKEDGVSPNAHCYNILLSSLCKERDIKMVEQLLKEIILQRVQLYYDTFIRVTSLFSKYHKSSSAVTLIIEMWNSGLIPDEAMSSPLFVGPAPRGNSADAFHPSMEGYLEETQSLISLSSDELPDVASSDELSDVVACMA